MKLGEFYKQFAMLKSKIQLILQELDAKMQHILEQSQNELDFLFEGVKSLGNLREYMKSTIKGKFEINQNDIKIIDKIDTNFINLELEKLKDEVEKVRNMVPCYMYDDKFNTKSLILR